MEKPRQSLSPYPHDASQSSVPLLRGMARQYHDQRLAPPLILPHSYAYSASLPSSNWKSLYPVSTTKLRKKRGKWDKPKTSQWFHIRKYVKKKPLFPFGFYYIGFTINLVWRIPMTRDWFCGCTHMTDQSHVWTPSYLFIIH